MQRRARAGVLVAAVATSAVCFVTCAFDDITIPPATDRPASRQPSAGAPSEHREADASPVHRVRVPRRRSQTAAALADAPAQAADFDIAEELGQPIPRGETPPPAPDEAANSTRPTGTGRVRTLLLQDGRPFGGGHVCFYPEEKYLAVKVWDGTASSDQAYLGVPMYTAFWPHFCPVLGSADGAQHFEERVRGMTGRDGAVTLDLPAGRSLVPYVRYEMSGIPLVSQPRVNVAEGGDAQITIEAAPMRTLTGRCADVSGDPLPGIWVQAISLREERPLSALAETSAMGAFQLKVFSVDREVRLRAIVPYHARSLGIHDAESEVPPIPAEMTIAGVVPDAGPVDVRMPPAPLVFVELTVATGEAPLEHVQIEGLAFDPRASAWGRLGGPQYRRAGGRPSGRRAVVALPAAEAVRPLMIWSRGRTLTAVDPRGADRISVEIPRVRPASVRGRGWRDGDRLRVVCFLGPEGQELPCIWLDGAVGRTDRWSREDAPVSAIEFQIVRDGVVVGRSARVPPGTAAAPEVAIDLE